MYDIRLDPCESQLKKCTLISDTNFRIGWAFIAPMTGILLINIISLILSLIQIMFALKIQISHEGEFKRLRRVAIGGILLIPALGLSFLSIGVISMVAIEIVGENLKLNIALAIPLTILISFAIDIVHFMLITCQIKETVLHKCCCYCKSRCCRKTLPQLAHSIHLNVVRRNPRTKQETNETVIQEPVSTNDDVIQEPVSTNDDVIQEPVSTNDDVIQEPVSTNDDVIQEPVSTNDDVIQEAVSTNDDVIQEPVSTNDDVIQEPVSTNDDVIQEAVSTNDDVIQELVSTNDDVIQEPVSTNDDVIQEPVSTNDDVFQEPVSTNDEFTAYSNEGIGATN